MFPFDISFTGNRGFSKQFKCYSMKKAGKSNYERLEYGGKTGLNIMYPMLFEVSSIKTSQKTHCGVLEFTAEEGRAYLPSWMMMQIGILEGEIISIKSISLPQGSFVKLQPQSTSFLDISNPKAVLEKELTNFACLTVDDIFSFKFNDKIFEMKVIELKPKNAVTIIEADIQVDFEAPPGYVEPTKEMSPASEDEPMLDIESKFVPFKGSGNSIRGIPIPISATKQAFSTGDLNYSPGQKSLSPSPSPSSRLASSFGSPKPFGASPKSAAPITLPPGKLIFSTFPAPSSNKTPALTETELKKTMEGFVAFTGKGNSLR